MRHLWLRWKCVRRVTERPTFFLNGTHVYRKLIRILIHTQNKILVRHNEHTFCQYDHTQLIDFRITSEDSDRAPRQVPPPSAEQRDPVATNRSNYHPLTHSLAHFDSPPATTGLSAILSTLRILRQKKKMYWHRACVPMMEAHWCFHKHFHSPSP